ncbi:hypothetical protein M2S00_06925 [Apilactobacillus sp. TMW 2.2459]|uniref:hypothetical protein n=1 Tax=Apilactobacillus xinyiensis TaxID=2841032 RepID=UPI0020106C63|nr:hypothetical protein [Apilactobacillus xinyiensis]MCL0312838.1 hypothetical protein [Apilactobacillus xinyiensis]
MLDFISYISSAIWFVSLILVIVYWRRCRKNKKQFPQEYKKMNQENGNAQKLKKSLIVLLVSWVIAGITGLPGENREEAKQDRIDTAQRKAESKKKAAENKKKQEDKKEADLVKATKENNEKKHLAAYKKDLNTIPDKTKGIISKAYIDESGSEQTTVVLSDEALDVSDSELKNIAHEAYNYMSSFISDHTPFPDDSQADSIRIIDSSGNLIAKTSWGNFKYVGE